MMTFNSDRFLWPAILGDERLLCLQYYEQCLDTLFCCVRTPPSEAMHTEMTLPWLPDRQAFAI